jgi:NADH-quinone oxidoreductase subunit M
MPWFAVMFLIVTMSSIGLPGTNGFVGEFLVLSGTFLADGPWDLRWYVAVAATGVILGAFYMLWMFQRVMFGPLKNEKNKKLTDLNLREWVVLTPLIVLIFVMGIKPQFIIDRMEPSIEAFRKVATTSRLPADDAEGRARIAEIRQRKTNAAEAK